MSDLANRLWSRVDRGPGCWTWTAGKTSKGYGEFMFHKKVRYAHRTAWELTFGKIPDGLCVRHTCDNPACCRPDHLVLGTQADNVQDMIDRGRDRKALGVDNGRAKLNPQKVRRLRRLRASGLSLKKIALIFGINDKTVWAVVSGKTWKHVK